MMINRTAKQKAFATVIVLLLLGFVGIYLIGNAMSLNRLKRELRAIERKHQKLLSREPPNMPNNKPVPEAQPGRFALPPGSP
jgi:hypothetical protein